MARHKRPQRPVNGVLLLDKPHGMTSNHALQAVKRLYQAKKAGHTGSLDPLATGLLPICLGEATKLSAYLLDADKHYWTRARLGERTATGDAEGEVVETRPVGAYSDTDIEGALAGFRGEIEQIPPMYSALKHQGKRLYELAREGKEVVREPRRVTIHELRLVGRDTDSLELDMRCSKGTYVRTLVEDLGETLGCGAHVTELRRLGVGPYEAGQMITLEALREKAEQGFEALDALLLPVDTAVSHWPRIELDKDSTFYVKQGQAVQVPGAPTDGLVALYRADGGFLGVGEVLDDGRIGPKRLMARG